MASSGRGASAGSGGDMEPLNRITYASQPSLPRLPVPDLDLTLKRYLKSVASLTTPDEFRETAMAVLDFLQPGGLGRELQQRLIHRAETEKKDASWLIDWWRQHSYLEFRMPVVINVSYYFQFKDCSRPGAVEQIERAAELALGVAAFKDMLAAERLPPDMSRKDPLCMNMYRYMFNTCRVPAPKRDQVVTYSSLTNHKLLVIRKNRHYLVDLGDPANRLSKTALERALAEVVRMADSLPRGEPVGALTAADRDHWAEILPVLLAAHPTNVESFREICRSSFAICLDDSAPVEHLEIARALLHGDGRDRWWDKSLQFIVFENGKAGMIGEHSMMDGMPVSAMVDWTLASLEKGSIPLGGSDRSETPVPADFVLTDSLGRIARNARADLRQRAADHEVACHIHSSYGRNVVKTFKQSPDAFAQQAIQLAYFRAYGKVAATYEPAHTRKFLHGRTATIRSASLESATWVQAMNDPSKSVEEKKRLLTIATTQHTNLTREALDGNDVDRHLLGLKLLVREGEEMPALFKDPVFARSSRWTISTSNLSVRFFSNWGWGQVVDDGIGVAYSTLPDDYRFSVTCRRGTGAALFMSELERALNDMGALYGHPAGSKPSPVAAMPSAKLPQIGSAAASAAAASRRIKSKL